jgi:hypothetical protein
MYRRITSNIFLTAPSGSQVVSAMRPPFRQTRASSAAAASRRLANMTPKVETTASNSPSRTEFSASPT